MGQTKSAPNLTPRGSSPGPARRRARHIIPIRRHGYDRASRDKGILLAMCAQTIVALRRSSCLAQPTSWLEFGFAFDLSARLITLVNAQTTEHAILDCHTWIDAHIVLKFAVVADCHVEAIDDILAHDAVLADLGAQQDMTEMPDLLAVRYRPDCNIGGLVVPSRRGYPGAA